MEMTRYNLPINFPPTSQGKSYNGEQDASTMRVRTEYIKKEKKSIKIAFKVCYFEAE